MCKCNSQKRQDQCGKSFGHFNKILSACLPTVYKKNVHSTKTTTGMGYNNTALSKFGWEGEKEEKQKEKKKKQFTSDSAPQYGVCLFAFFHWQFPIKHLGCMTG